MKTKMLLQTTGLTIMIMLLTTFLTNAQIQIQGFAADHEGVVAWDADGSGPEPEAYGHTHPFGWGSSRYYSASRDFDGIDSDPDAALCHFIDDITGFPLFVQALADNGFTAGQVKVKLDLMDLKDDIEGEDWFTFNNMHYYNRYDGYYFIELNGEPMISGYINYIFTKYVEGAGNTWPFESGFTQPYDVSAGSSASVQAVAATFMSDMAGEELRFNITNLIWSGEYLNGNGRDGSYMEIVSGCLEKGLPEIPVIGFGADHKGMACWNADGTGPEPEATGHTFWYGGTEHWITYYFASRDYDGIDPDPNAASCHFIDDVTGFPNLEIQLDYRGYTLDQLKVKSSIATLGNDIEGEDWGLDGNIHWYHTYGNTITIEIDDEPILECVIDTNYGFWDMDNPYDNWESYSNYATMSDISTNASSDAQYVAASFLKDLGGHSIKLYSDGNYAGEMPYENGRIGVFHEILSGRLEAKLPAGTHIWDSVVSGTWDLEGSPYIVMGYLEIPDGETLIIEPGVVVKLNTTELLVIYGCIIAEGTPKQPILFTALDNSVRWGGMGWDKPKVSNETSKIKHCIFEHAYAYDPENLPGHNSGGAIVVNDYENIEISHCLFRYNLADKPGLYNPAGGVIFLIESSLHISHCIFHDNKAGHGGAIALSTNSNPVINNCLFYNNEAINWYGGAILTFSDCSPTFINCTFADNYAIHGGGVAELQGGGNATFTNCILWGNTAGTGYSQISSYIPDDCLLTIYYSDVEDGLNGIDPEIQTTYLNNIEVDPEFMGAGEEFPYALSEISPCIDAGWPADWYMIPALDIIGNERVFDGNQDGSLVIDMGAYEFVGKTSSLVLGDNSIMKLSETGPQIFPNPFSGEINVSFTLDEENYIKIEIFNLTCKKVAVLNESVLEEGDHKLTFSGHHLSAGVYFCRLQAGDRIMMKKIIKMR